MHIWIVNYYTSPDCSNPRYQEFAKRFMAKGWKVTTFNANYTGNKTDPLFVKKKYGDLDFVHVRTASYKGNGLKRMYSIWKFAQLIKNHVSSFEKADVILHNLHAPFDYPIALAANKIGAKYIAEVWDLWPDQFVHLGLVSPNNPILPIFYWIEKKIYYRADQIVFTSLGCLDYIKRQGWTTETGGKIDMTHVHYINNGVDLEKFDRDRITYTRDDEDIRRSDIYKIVYMGSINYANHLKTLIDAAAILQNNPKYHFFIYGDGVERNQLEEYASKYGIMNVHFKERSIPLCEVAWVVSQSSLNIMTYESGFAYLGISAGKLFQYLAAGKPILCNVKIEHDDIITDNNIGIAKDMANPVSFAQSISDIVEQPSVDYKAMCVRVRKVAERFDYNRLASDEINVLEAAMSD